jgi:hypothetical protein
MINSGQWWVYHFCVNAGKSRNVISLLSKNLFLLLRWTCKPCDRRAKQPTEPSPFPENNHPELLAGGQQTLRAQEHFFWNEDYLINELVALRKSVESRTLVFLGCYVHKGITWKRSEEWFSSGNEWKESPEIQDLVMLEK